MKKLVVGAACISALFLSGCSGDQSQVEPAQTITALEHTEQPHATPEQVASVIAEYDSDWRELADGQGECRAIWTMGDFDNVTDRLDGVSRFLQEGTGNVTASIALRNLGELDAPPELEDLVFRTTGILGIIAKTDIEGTCGTESWPSVTDECNESLAANFMNFGVLTDVLDAWGPYL